MSLQNYFGDAWNVLDFVIVIGSIVDIIAAKALVSAPRARLFEGITHVGSA